MRITPRASIMEDVRPVDKRPRRIKRLDSDKQYDWGWGLQIDMFAPENKNCATLSEHTQGASSCKL